MVSLSTMAESVRSMDIENNHPQQGASAHGHWKLRGFYLAVVSFVAVVAFSSGRLDRSQVARFTGVTQEIGIATGEVIAKKSEAAIPGPYIREHHVQIADALATSPDFQEHMELDVANTHADMLTAKLQEGVNDHVARMSESLNAVGQDELEGNSDSRSHLKKFVASPVFPRRSGSTVVSKRTRAVGPKMQAQTQEEMPGTERASVQPLRVRFAPSPTGILHVGGARTALFNWVFAKSQGGELVLRVEDTDMARSTSESEAKIIKDLQWLGISWSEGPDVGGKHGPYRQSERITAGIYQKQLDKLISDGRVYRCFHTAEELDAMRAGAEDDGSFVIRSRWASASEDAVEEMLKKEVPFVYRFRVPPGRDIVVNDMILGEVTWNSDDLGGDFVIVRQTGVPMYNFGVVVDDASMEITHVLRAQEHLTNTPRQVLIYEALGLDVPRFGHMPLILATDRSKLSKRHGAVSVTDYQEQGYLPSGMVNYLTQLGWTMESEKEIYQVDELLDNFQMERMSKVSAIFDEEKCKWVNGNHIRLMDDETALELIGGELVRQGMVREVSGEFVKQVSLLLRDRIRILSEAAHELKSILDYNFEAMLESEEDQQYIQDGSLRETAEYLVGAKARGEFENIGSDPEVLKQLIKSISQARGGVKKKALMVPTRLCLTGRNVGPDMAIIFNLLSHINDSVLFDVVPLDRRIEILAEWSKTKE